MGNYAKYLELFDKVKTFYESETGEGERASLSVGHPSIEDVVYAENVYLYEMAFEQQFHFAPFYAWVKLREQEIRNIRWIVSMIRWTEKITSMTRSFQSSDHETDDCAGLCHIVMCIFLGLVGSSTRAG